MIVTVHHAKTNLSKLIARAEAGEEIVIARGSAPAVRLTPVQPAATGVEEKPRRTPGAWKGKFELPESFFDPLPDDELALWNGDAD